MSDVNALVSVCMITYNHDKYIAQAIDSVFMQKTDFDFELVIGEDCSTDKTREIVLNYKAKYPDKIKLLLQEKNVGMIQNFIGSLKACTGKYIALLEGDDYWTDPYKLQKQVDFLEANPGHGLVATLFHSVINEKLIPSKQTSMKLYNWADISFQELLIVNPIGTLTTMVRSDVLIPSIKSITENLKCVISVDAAQWLEIALRSKVAILKEYTANYRILSESASHSKDINKEILYINDYFDIKKYYIKNFIIGNYKKKLLQEAERDNKRRLFNLYKKYLQPKCLLVKKRDLLGFKPNKNTLKDVVYLVSIYFKPLRSLIRSFKKANQELEE